MDNLLHVFISLPSLFFPPPLPEVSPALVGKNKMELYVFDIQKEAISLHQPLARVLAGMYGHSAISLYVM